MTKEFKDYSSTGKLRDAYKVSANYRDRTLKIWTIDRSKKRYLRHLKASFISVAEIDEVMYDMTYDDFKQFLKIDIFSCWY